MAWLSPESAQSHLPLDQSILVVWPHLTLLAALTLVCFGLSCRAGGCGREAPRGDVAGAKAI